MIKTKAYLDPTILDHQYLDHFYSVVEAEQKHAVPNKKPPESFLLNF